MHHKYIIIIIVVVVVLVVGEYSRYGIVAYSKTAHGTAVGSSGGVRTCLDVPLTWLHMRGGARGPKPKPSSHVCSDISSCAVCGRRTNPCTMMERPFGLPASIARCTNHRSRTDGGWSPSEKLRHLDRPIHVPHAQYALLPGLILTFLLLVSSAA